MSRLSLALALAGSFLAGMATMAWYLTRTHDDREAGPGPLPVIELGHPLAIRWSEGQWTRGVLAGIGWDPKWQAYRISLRDVVRSPDDEPGGGWER